jgi:Zn-dependent protease with chaperone function
VKRVTGRELLASFSWFQRRRLRRSPRRLDLKLRLVFLLQWLGFFVLFVSSLLVLIEHAPPVAVEHPVLFSITVLVAVTKHSLSLLGLFGGETRPFREASAGMRGGLEPRHVDALARKMGERFGSKEKPNVFIAVDKEANALSTNSMLLNFVPRFNAVFLNSYLCNALKPDELRAILVHELAHFYRYIGPLGRNAWLGIVGSVAACVALYAADPEILDSPLLALAVVWWAPLPFLWLFNKIAALGLHDLEYACDAVAAELVGVEPIVNALLKIGDRQEVYDLVEREMGRHLAENPKAKPADVATELLDRLPDQPVTVEEARRILSAQPLPGGRGGSKKQAREFLEYLRLSRSLRKALKVVRWSEFDTIHRNGRLDRDELHRYVRALASGRDAATHELAADHPAAERYQTHPSMRNRILYLYLHFLAADDA